jgi:glyoxylase-like metal-dependent hydrolase (beta-lactamase superfamily II)
MTIKADKFLRDNEEIHIGSGLLRVIHTPGHTAGCACYYDEENRVVFSGDTLFYESIGRTDLHSGDSRSITASIKQKLYTLPDDVRVFCGHGEHTTIGHEKKRNPYVSV